MYSKVKLGAAALVAAMGTFVSADAATIRVTITNHSEVGGLNLTPLFVAFHDGSYDAFDVGGMASPGTEQIAELGAAGTAIAEAQAADPNALTGVITAPGGFPGAPVIEPGETASMVFNVDALTQRFFTFLSMVIPSNDTFIGNPDALELFDAAGNFLGNQNLILTGNNIWDAGTEANDLADGAAFVENVDATGGTVTGDLVTLSDGLNAVMAALASGAVLDPALADFVSNRASFQLATISIEAAPVPVPAALPLMMAGLGAGAFIRRRSKKTA